MELVEHKGKNKLSRIIAYYYDASKLKLTFPLNYKQVKEMWGVDFVTCRLAKTEEGWSAGNVVNNYVYDSFGNIVEQTGTIDNPYTYTGREFDAESGLYYYRARYYDAQIGRFISEDPIGFVGAVNFYAYARNNPLNLIDPLGLYWEYSQSNGQLSYVDNQSGARTSIATGYSGSGDGLNNPDMQNVRDVGPIPQGTYYIGEGTTRPGLGSVVMALTPSSDTFIPDNRTGGFLIHADNNRGDQSASSGCIVLPRNIREQINNSDDNELRVVRNGGTECRN